MNTRALTIKELKSAHMSTVEARENFSELINTAAYGQRPVILTRRNRPIAAVVGLEELLRLKKIAGESDI